MYAATCPFYVRNDLLNQRACYKDVRDKPKSYRLLCKNCNRKTDKAKKQYFSNPIFFCDDVTIFGSLVGWIENDDELPNWNACIYLAVRRLANRCN